MVSIKEDAKCGDLQIGDIITRIEGNNIKNKRDFNIIEKSVATDRRVSMVVSGGPGSCIVLNAGELGIEVSDIFSKGFRFGPDLVGGEKFLLSSSGGLSYGDVSYISDALEKRLKVAGMKNSVISAEGKSIAIYAPAGSDVGLILVNGRIEAVIEQELTLSNDTGKIKVGNSSYDILWGGSDVIVEGVVYGVDDFFEIDGVQFKVLNSTNESIVVSALVFDNSGVGDVVGSVGYVNYETVSKQYQFNIPVELSQTAGDRFSEITDGLIPLYGIGSGALNGMLVYYLDGEEVSRLSIPADMAGTPIKTISIVGSENTMREAIDKKMLIEIGLDGYIEKDLYVENIEPFPGAFGWLIWVGAVVLIGSVAAMFAVGLIRYKSLRIGAVGSLLLGLEITYILGFVSFLQSVMSSGWVMDAGSLIGLCVFSIISAVQMIILTEKIVKMRVVKNYSRFVVVVFVVGFIALFTQLNRVGLVLVLGSMIGSILTKPAYIDFLADFR